MEGGGRNQEVGPLGVLQTLCPAAVCGCSSPTLDTACRKVASLGLAPSPSPKVSRPQLWEREAGRAARSRAREASRHARRLSAGSVMLSAPALGSRNSRSCGVSVQVLLQ